MKRNNLVVLLIPLVVLFVGCGAQTRSIPVGSQRMQVNASVGGPLVDAFGTTIPIPYGIVGATYGLSNSTEVFCDFHATAAAYKFLGATPGIVYFPTLHWGRFVPGVSAEALLFSDFTSSRIYPEITTSAAYRLNEHWSPYIAYRQTFQSGSKPHYIPSAMTGATFRHRNLQYFAELQWLDLNRDNRWNPVDYHGISHRGALSIQVGASLDLPEWKWGGK